MRRSIKTRLVINFMLVIVITVVILEVVLINGIKDYYYRSVEDILSNQILFSTDFYNRYFSTSTLQDIIIDDIDVFWRHTNAQVQILSLEGELLMDSLGVTSDNFVKTSDIEKAITTGKGVWIGNVPYDDSSVIAVTMPLRNQDNEIGIIRFISSLQETNKIVRRISIFLLWMGLSVIFISGIVSIFLANSIVKPLQEVTFVAQKMADGQFRTRSKLKLEDEIGQLSNTLNYMAEEILKKEQIKNDFISSISHELRTPLTSIKGWAVTLKSEDINENSLLLDGLDIIEKESNRLTQMVEELLDFSRFISGRIRLEKDEFNIVNTINMISKQLTIKAKNNKINFDVIIDDSLCTIIGDENRIKQVLINLLDNAIKFTNEGGQVTLSAYKENEMLVLKVEDNGVGIPEEDLPNVKEKFYKGKNSKSHSGIGLSICEEITKLHGGSLDIESEVDKGTIVKVTLPIKEDVK